MLFPSFLRHEVSPCKVLLVLDQVPSTEALSLKSEFQNCPRFQDLGAVGVGMGCVGCRMERALAHSTQGWSYLYSPPACPKPLPAGTPHQGGPLAAVWLC